MSNQQDWTTKELAEAGGVDQSRIRQLCLYGEFNDKAYQKAGRWFIPKELGDRWLAKRLKKGKSKDDQA